MAKITANLIQKKDTPGVLAPPPLIYALTFGAAWLLQLLLPMPLAPISLEIPAYIVLGLGAFIVLWSFSTLRGAETSGNPYKPAENLVTTGPFRFSRNPIYLAMGLLYLGASLFLNMLWPLVLFPILLGIMLFGVIFREEHYLLLRFGTKYLKYKATVRRWL